MVNFWSVIICWMKLTLYIRFIRKSELYREGDFPLVWPSCNKNHLALKNGNPFGWSEIICMCFIRPEWPELEVPFLNRNTERNLIVSPWSNIDPTHTQLWELIFEGAFLFSCNFRGIYLHYDFEISSLKKPVWWTRFFVYFKLEFCRLHRQ